MSNCDGTINEGAEAALKAEPSIGRHSAWNFCGYVYFQDGRFYEDIWVYHSKQETISADSLQELMEKANEAYGSE